MGYINTIRDLEASTYGLPNFGGNSLLKQAGVVQGLHTAHDIADAAASGVTAIDSTGLYNVLYGQKVWSMLNREVNALAMLSKRPYTSSGWRILKSRPFGGSGSTLTLKPTKSVVFRRTLAFLLRLTVLALWPQPTLNSS